MALVLAKPLEITVRHLLRNSSAVEVVGVYFHDVRSRLLLVVERVHQLIVAAGITDACVADSAADVRLDHTIHLRVGDQRDWPVNVFEKRVSRKLRRAHKVGRVQLVLVQGVVPERLEHVGQQANVAYQIERHVLFETLAVKVFPNVLSVCIVRL